MSDQFERSLKNILYRVVCPDPHLLGEYQLGLVDRSQKVDIREHLSECAHCRKELGVYVRYTFDTADRPVAEAYDTLWNRAEQFVVRLVSDLNPSLLGVRNSDGQLETQTEFGIRRAGEFLVNLTIQPHPEESGAKTMIGHVSHIEDPNYPFEEWDVQFWQANELVHVGPLDQHNAFLLHTQKDDPFEIVLTGTDAQIRLLHQDELD